MNTAILPKIEKLLAAGKQDEARALLRAELSAPLTAALAEQELEQSGIEV